MVQQKVNQTPVRPAGIEKIFGDFADKVILKTILDSLSDEDAKLFLEFISTGNFSEAENLIKEKIPDLEEKAEKANSKHLASILKRIKNE